MTYLGLRDPAMVTMLDEALALRLIADDARLAADPSARNVPGIGPDERYSAEGDYDDAADVAAVAA